MKKKVKKKTISELKKEAWTVFSKWVRNRDNWKCYTCGKQYDGTGSSRGGLHAGHFISRRHNATMFNEMNVHGQCMYCNMWDYGNSGVYAQNLIRDYGKEKFDELVRLGRTIKQFSPVELEEIKRIYQQKLEKLNAQN